MFESNDDIDVDEFLSGVFDNEQANFANDFSLKVGDPPNLNTQSKYLIKDGEKGNSGQTGAVDQYFQSDHSDEKHHDNKENKRKHILFPVPPRSKRERKFPGPAGLLPDRKSAQGTLPNLDSIVEAHKSPEDSVPDDFSSQGRCSGSILEEEPWQNFLADLGDDRNILDVVNVASVKRKAAAKCFVGRKVPFLAAVLHHLDVSSPDPCIILRDSTGEIHGTLHREVWELFAGELIIGSVLVIKNVGLLSTGTSSRRHYLNITANNLATIYSANPDKLQKKKLSPFTKQDFVQIVESWRTFVSPSHVVGSPASVGSPALFNSSLPSSSPVSSSRNLNCSRSFLNGPERTRVNQRQMNTTRGSNITPISAQNVRRNSNMRCTSEHSSTHLAPTKLAGKDLLSSFTHNTYQGSPNTSSIANSLQSGNRSISSLNHTNSFQNRIFSSSSASHSNQPFTSTKTFGNQSVQEENTNPSSFNFNPIVLKPQRVTSIFPENNGERLLSNTQQIIKTQHKSSLDFKNAHDSRNNPKPVLSQSSQLTAEEQSLVESVLDGIDADTLFDDDF